MSEFGVTVLNDVLSRSDSAVVLAGESVAGWLRDQGLNYGNEVVLYDGGVPHKLVTEDALEGAQFWPTIDTIHITGAPLLGQSEPVFGDRQYAEGHEDNNEEQGVYTPETRSAMSGMAATGAMLARAVPHGAGVGVADEANEAIKAAVTAGLIKAGLPPELAQNEVIEKLALVAAPLAIYYLATAHAGLLPGFVNPQFLAAGAEMAVEAKSRDYVQPLVAALGPMLKEVANVGEKHATVTVLRGGASDAVDNAEAAGG